MTSADEALIAEVLALRRPGVGDRSVWNALRGKYPGLTRNRVRTIWMNAAPVPAVINGNSALTLYEAACRALSEACSIVEVKDIADRASALKEYGRLAKDRMLEIDAAELRIKAERKLGLMLIASKEMGQIAEGRPKKNSAETEEFSRVTLPAAGIDHKLSARAQKLASIPERAFEDRLAVSREQTERRAGRVTLDILKDGDKRERRVSRETQLGEAQAADNLKLPQKRYGVILADPPWRFKTYSRETGMDRAADNHYPTSETPDIAKLPVADIAADDCVLFLWATVPMLPDALDVMKAWGFTYKSHRVWYKSGHTGTGYWFRNQHELLLVGTRGHVPAPAPGDNWVSVELSPLGEHSEKPDWQYELAEAYFPSLPKIELNARRARNGWARWGLDAPATDVCQRAEIENASGK